LEALVTVSPIAENGRIGDQQTAVLVSTNGSIDGFSCPRFPSPSVSSPMSSSAEVVDGMPPLGRKVTANHRLVRMLRCVCGSMDLEIDVAPRFDYGRTPHERHATPPGVVFATDDLTWTLDVTREVDDDRRRDRAGNHA
jgi:hypothetical protein